MSQAWRINVSVRPVCVRIFRSPASLSLVLFFSLWYWCCLSIHERLKPSVDCRMNLKRRKMNDPTNTHNECYFIDSLDSLTINTKSTLLEYIFCVFFFISSHTHHFIWVLFGYFSGCGLVLIIPRFDVIVSFYLSVVASYT